VQASATSRAAVAERAASSARVLSSSSGRVERLTCTSCAAATLSEAASVAAARLVHVILATRPDDELSTRAELAARAATAAREVALACP
jgi:hypothetical protein